MLVDFNSKITESMTKQIGGILAEGRQRQNKTKEDISRDTGIPIETVSEYEKGTCHMRVLLAIKIASACEKDIVYKVIKLILSCDQIKEWWDLLEKYPLGNKTRVRILSDLYSFFYGKTGNAYELYDFATSAGTKINYKASRIHMAL